MKPRKILIIGSGNAALCAGIAALEKGGEVLVMEKAPKEEAGGNSAYTAGAMRFPYDSGKDLLPLLANQDDPRIEDTDFGSYPKSAFEQDLLSFNGSVPLTLQQRILVDQSLETIHWMQSHNISFAPIYKRQSFVQKGRYIFWGGLTMAAVGEGMGLVEAEREAFLRLGGEILYETEALALLKENEKIIGARGLGKDGEEDYYADAVILACGGFEANPALRKKYLGSIWELAKVRGSANNMGQGIEMALDIGASFYGNPSGCHAVPMDLHMVNYGNPEIPYIERKQYRKICYFLGVMLNEKGLRFVDEGKNFRNYTYAQFGKAILEQPMARAWQIFDAKVMDLLYSEYHFWDAHFVEAESLEDLVEKLEGIDKLQALKTLDEFNKAVDGERPFNPSILDGKATKGLKLNKSHWANSLDQPPFRAYPVTCGITFTYAGLKVNEEAAVLDTEDKKIPGLFACGELVGGVFLHGYPGGSGLTSGAVFGRLAGYSAVQTP